MGVRLDWFVGAMAVPWSLAACGGTINVADAPNGADAPTVADARTDAVDGMRADASIEAECACSDVANDGSADGLGGDASHEPVDVQPVAPNADPSFGAGGLATVNIGSDLGAFWSVAIQGDGKIVAMGRNYEAIVLARVLPTGGLDPTFGNGGLVFAPYGAPRDGITFGQGGVAIAPDGKIVVAGFANGLGDALAHEILLRYEPDGTLDPSFGMGGAVLPAQAPEMTVTANAVAVQSDGRIVVASTRGIERYETDGTPDASFGFSGVVDEIFGPLASGELQAVTIQPDGKIVASGSAFEGAGEHFAIARVTTTGALDTTFAGTGYSVETVTPSGPVSARGIALQPNGKIVVAAQRTVTTGSTFAVGRINADGTTDLAFGTNGWATDSATSSGGLALGVGVQSTGKIVAVGSARVGSSPVGMVRFNADGTLDASFAAGTGGETLGVAIASDDRVVTAGGSASTTSGVTAVSRFTPDGAGDPSFTNTSAAMAFSVDRAMALATQPDGKILVGGAGGIIGPASIARLTPSGALDTTFGTNGIVPYVQPLSVVTSLAVDASGHILVGGQSNAFEMTDGAPVVRLTSSGMLDTTYGTNGVAGGQFVAGQPAQSSAMLVAPNGQVYLAGYTVSAGALQFGLLRVGTDGTPDASFGSNGGVVFALYGSLPASAAQIALQPDGSVVAAGGSNLTSLLVRVLPNGTPDASFGTGGVISRGAGAPLALQLQSDGKIVLVTGTRGSTSTTVSIARYETNGTHDTTFGTNGFVEPSLGATDILLANVPTPLGLAIQSDGSLLLGATSVSDFVTETATLLRYTPSGAADTTFGNGGSLTLAMGPASSALHAIAPQPDGSTLLAGRVWTPTGGSDFAVVRLH